MKARAREVGFDLCGVAAVGDHPELGFLERWLTHGYAGNMQYMTRTAARRRDVRRVLPSARSVISLGTVYNVERPYSIERDDRTTAEISRYAWGDDYHDVLGHRMEELLAWMRSESAESFDARAYVDTGPVQERVYAQQAGLGWIGKNTCLINPELGSWLFLSEILCSLPLETDGVALDQCGTCTLCLEACPTGALPEPWVLDATRCISYLTIEVKQSLPVELREAVGRHVYGCDICQDVCPWNAQAAHSTDDAWQPRPVLDGPDLVTLWRQSDDELGPVVEHSAMSHTGLRNLRRNVAVALGNSATPEATQALSEPPVDPSKTDPVVAEHVAWARERLSGTSRGRVEPRASEPPDE